MREEVRCAFIYTMWVILKPTFQSPHSGGNQDPLSANTATLVVRKLAPKSPPGPSPLLRDVGSSPLCSVEE